MLPPSSKAVPSLVVTFVLLVHMSVEGRWTRDENKDEDEKLLKKMLDAVELGLGFFSADFSNINLDALFAIRVGQGQIMQALGECQSSGSCSAPLKRRLAELTDDIDVTARTALKYVQEEDPVYFQQFLPTIDQPYLLPFTPLTLTHLQETPAGTDDSYDEEKGDSCYSRLFGTYKENGQPVKPCNVTQACWSMMTTQNRSRYSVTHQLLYFVLIQKQGCLKTVENAMDSNIRETEARFCGSIYNEAVGEVKDGQVSEMDQDLFLEQVVLCGCLGFENFLRSDWMRMVLTWQQASGCFTMNDPDLMATEVILSDLQEEGRQLMKDLEREVEMIEKQHPGRKLLREQVMNDGCLAHKSGLGFANLCLYTRYLIRQLFLHQ